MNAPTIENKSKISGLRANLVFALPFEFRTSQSPRDFTRSLSKLVRYPKLINDLGRSVDSSRISENSYRFEIRQKRYLGRGTYSISAIAIGKVSYEEVLQISYISGELRLGGQYLILLSIMTAVVLASSILIFLTILFLPLSILMLLVIALHWSYFFADRQDLLNCLDDLVEQRPIKTDYDINQIPSSGS